MELSSKTYIQNWKQNHYLNCGEFHYFRVSETNGNRLTKAQEMD